MTSEPGVLDAISLLRLEASTASLHRRLSSASIRHVFLKGVSFARWLYDRSEIRVSGDVDVLVPRTELGRTAAMLRGGGYRIRLRDTVSTTFAHDTELEVDVHHGLKGAAIVGDAFFGALGGHVETLPVAGSAVPILDEAGRCLHTALHVVQSWPTGARCVEDLRRAVGRADQACWVEAQRLAIGIGADRWLAAGLRSIPEGCAIADALGIDAPGLLDRIASSRRPEHTVSLHLLRVARPRRERVRAAARLVAPPWSDRDTSGVEVSWWASVVDAIPSYRSAGRL